MAASLEDLQNEIARLRREYQDLTGKPAALFDVKNIDEANAAVRTLEGSVDNAKKEARELERGFGGVYGQIQGILGELNKSEKATNKVTKAFKGVERIARDLKDEQQGFNDLSVKELKARQKKLKSAQAEVKFQADTIKAQHQSNLLDANGNKLQGAALSQRLRSLETQGKITAEEAAILRGQEEGFSVIEETNRKLQERIDKEERINDAMGLGGAILGSTKAALDQLGMGSLADKLGFSEAEDSMRELAKELEDAGEDMSSFATKGKILREGFSSMGSSLIENLKDPLSASLFVVTSLIQALGSVDKMTGEVAKNLGMSYKEANNMVSDMTDIANLSGDARINTEGLVKSQLALSKALGTNSQISGELLVDFTKLTEQAGFSGDAMTNLTKISSGTGKSLQENTAELLGQAKAFNINNGLALNEKELVEEIANTSAATVLTLGKSSKELVANVAAAKQFGINMQQAENIASGLLNFQQSIESEMEAELLTGKQLNLEQARMLALKGETGKAAAEVLKQVGSSAEFSEMNVIAQEALAKSMGMTREELAKSLIEREALANIGMEDLSAQEAYNKLKKEGLSDDEIAKKLGNEQLANQLKSESVQERFANLTAKLQDLFIGLAEPIMAIVDPLMNLVTAVLPAINLLLQPIKTTFDGIAKIITGDFGELSVMEAILGSIAVVLGTIVGLGKLQEELTEGSLTNLKETLGIEAAIATYEMYSFARKEGESVLDAASLALEESKLGTLLLQGAQLASQSALKARDFIVEKGSYALQLLSNTAALAYNGILAVANSIKLGGLLPLIASMAMTAFSSLAAIPFIGPVLGIAGAAAALALGYGYYSKAQSAGDMYSPADGKTQVSTKEGGLFELSKNDDLIAAPGAADAMMNGGEGESQAAPSGGVNIAPLVAQMSQMNATLNAILAKEGTVTLDGTKVGTALTVASSKLQ